MGNAGGHSEFHQHVHETAVDSRTGEGASKLLERTCQVRNRVRQSRTLGSVRGGAQQCPRLLGPQTSGDVSRTPEPGRAHARSCEPEDSPRVVVRPGMLWVRILGEDDEFTGVTCPVAQAMEVERTPHRGALRRGLDPHESVSVSHTPPAFHVDLHLAPHTPTGTRPYTEMGNGITKVEGENRLRHRKEELRPSVGIPCWPSRGSTDSPGARETRLRNKSRLHSRSKERQA